MNDKALPFHFLEKLLSLTADPLYLVGGTVRDLLLGRSGIRDIDLLMPANTEAVARSFADRIQGSFFFLDEERGITRVVKQEGEALVQFDFTNFDGADLAADLKRRDFTVNAMALDLREFIRTGSLDTVVDLFQGREDVCARVIRVVTPAVLDDDPLRLLRAARFGATLGFTIDDQTTEAIQQRAAKIKEPSPERIRDELFLILAERSADSHLGFLDSLGLFSQLFPELEPLRGFAPGMYHVHDVLTHSFKTAGFLDGVLDDLPRLSPEHAQEVMAHLEEPLEQLVPRKAALRFACLLHDMAKPETYSHADGKVRFHGHDILGAEKAAQVCRRFRLSRNTEKAVVAVIRQHMRIFNLATPAGPSRNALYRYCRDVGDALPESLLLAQADARATSLIMPKEKFSDTEGPMTQALAYYYTQFRKVEERPLVTGQDLIDLGMTPGPRFREILEAVKEQQAEGAIKDRREALEYIRKVK